MLTMPEINCIKLMRNQKSLSINKISKTLGINWRTAKKYADGDQLPEENKKKKSGMMYDEQWGEIVGDWLWEDLKLKKKDRRTINVNYKMYTFACLRMYRFTGFPDLDDSVSDKIHRQLK